MLSCCLEGKVARMPVLRRNLMRAWCIPHRDMISLTPFIAWVKEC